jgi:hypothetical protein
MRWSGRSDEAPRKSVTYWCAQGHATAPLFASDVAAPSVWDCPRCGLPAGQDEDNPPVPPRAEPYKSHLAYVKERRSDADAAAILAEALARVQRRRR